MRKHGNLIESCPIPRNPQPYHRFPPKEKEVANAPTEVEAITVVWFPSTTGVSRRVVWLDRSTEEACV